MKKFFIKNIIILLALITCSTSVFAEGASMDFSINLSEYLQIQTITSPVLTANITDNTGNLLSPLFSKFKVVSNNPDTKTLYLRANTLTQNGNEEAIFEMNGRRYIAFANLEAKPTGQSLANCKLGTHPKESPGIVAYPITSILGAKTKYVRGQGKYEVYVDSGVTYITVNIGSNVLRSSFASNDPKGFYQATISLTESEI